MATNNILELNGNESLNELIDKLNSNFDQLASLNGGPQGPVGKQGVPGLPGLQGPQGIQGEKGEDGTKIEGVDKDAEWPDTYEQGKIYIGVNGDGSVVLRQRDDSEIGYSESVLLNKSAIDTAGFFEKNSDVSDTHIYASKQITDSPRLVFGSGDGYEQIDNQIWGESNFTPYEKSKLILNSSGNKEIFEGKTIEVDGNNVSVSTTSSIYLQNENSYAGASIGVASYGDKTMVDILGIDDSKADLYVDGRVMSVNGFTVEPNNDDTKMFGAKSGSLGGSCSYIYGIADNENNSLLCGAKFVTDGSVDFVSGASKNMNFSSGENFLFANSSNNNAEFPIFGIKRADKENDGIIFKYEGKNNLMFEEKNATGWTTSYDYKAVTQTGVKGEYRITLGGQKYSDIDDQFYIKFLPTITESNKPESAGLFVNSKRLSYYGGDGMQIKLNHIPIKHFESGEGTDALVETNVTNLIEFCVQEIGNASLYDYHFDYKYNGKGYFKIGEISTSAGTSYKNLNVFCKSGRVALYDSTYRHDIANPKDPTGIWLSSPKLDKLDTVYTIFDNTDGLEVEKRRGDYTLSVTTGGISYGLIHNLYLIGIMYWSNNKVNYSSILGGGSPENSTICSLARYKSGNVYTKWESITKASDEINGIRCDFKTRLWSIGNRMCRLSIENSKNQIGVIVDDGLNPAKETAIEWNGYGAVLVLSQQLSNSIFNKFGKVSVLGQIVGGNNNNYFADMQSCVLEPLQISNSGSNMWRYVIKLYYRRAIDTPKNGHYKSESYKICIIPEYAKFQFDIININNEEIYYDEDV